MNPQNELYNYLLQLGDNSLILGHRLSELCGHGPTLETDIALTNISLDLYGQVRNIFQYAATIKGDSSTEDSIAFLRTERQYYNCILLEQPNRDFAHVIVRQFFFDVYQEIELQQLSQSKDKQIEAIAKKSLKETKYHVRFSGEWMNRLGQGTEESRNKMQTAIDRLYPFTGEFFQPNHITDALEGIAFKSADYKSTYFDAIHNHINDAGLTVPEATMRSTKGRQGIHSENMGYILSELQYMQRAYPNMQW